MTVSSRTPEGFPFGCPICGKVANLEPSFPGGDAVCPRCGHLLWWFRDKLSERLSRGSGLLHLNTLLTDFGFDSLDMVELRMEIEDEYHIELSDEELEQIRTVEDLLRLIERLRREEEG